MAVAEKKKRGPRPKPVPEERPCRGCGNIYATASTARRDFHRCSDCLKARKRIEYKRRRIAYIQNVQRWNYGVKPEDWNDMMIRQNGACAICSAWIGAPFGSGVACIDHDHETGRVRGLLCHACNRGIAALRDNPENMRKAALYVASC